MAARLDKTWILIRPHVGQEKARIAAVVLLGMLLAAVQASPLLLLQPLWNQVLFPDASPAQALRTIGSTVEGVANTAVALELAVRHAIVLPPKDGRRILTLFQRTRPKDLSALGT